MNRENLKIKYFEALRYNRISEKIGEYKDYSTESLEKEIKALIQDKRMKCYTPLLAKILFFKKLISALKILRGSY